MAYTPPVHVYRPPNHKNYYDRNSVVPKVLSVGHMTGNQSTSKDTDGIAEGSGCYGEWAYAARNAQAADGPSAHDYIARNGRYIEMLRPAKHVAWSNGDLMSPRISYPGVAYLVRLRGQGVNANRGCYREIEMVAYPGTHPVTAAQRETWAYLIARDSIDTGLPIIPGTTVLVHSWINWVNRQNCPFPPTKRDALLKAVCDRAIVIKSLLQGTAPASTTGGTMSIFSRAETPGRFTILPNTKVNGFKPVGDAWEVVKTWVPQAAPSSGPFVAILKRLSGTVVPSSLLEVKEGFFADLYVPTAEVEETIDPAAPTVPVVDTTPFSQEHINAAKKAAAIEVAIAAQTAAAKF